MCILDGGSAALSTINTRNGAIKTTTTKWHDTSRLIGWLTSAFGRNGSQPESLYLIGSRSELDAIAGPLDDGLCMPVVATHDAQLALARGAALSGMKHFKGTATEGPSRFASHARTLAAVAAVVVASLLALSAAGSPMSLVQNKPQQQATPSSPRAAVPATPVVFPPPPAGRTSAGGRSRACRKHHRRNGSRHRSGAGHRSCHAASRAPSRRAARSTHAGRAAGRTRACRSATRGSGTASAGSPRRSALQRLTVSYSRAAAKVAASPTIPFTGYSACANDGPPPGVPSQIVSPDAHNWVVFAA